MTTELKRLQKRVSALMAVQNIAQELMSELDRWRLLNKILNAAVQVLNADTGSLLIWAPPDDLEFALSADPRVLGHRIPATQGIAGWVFTNEQPLIVGDVSQDSRWSQEVNPDFQTHSLVAVPLMTPTERIGVVEVLNKQSGQQFDEEDRDILSALAAQAAQAIVNARLYQELEEEKNRMIEIEDQMHKKMARDLHDGPAQGLAAMMMNIEFILRLYEHEPSKVPEELTQLRQTLSKTLAQVRNTMFELRPVILETQGLQAALKSYVERLLQTEGMNIHLDLVHMEERLPARIERLCFDIVREAVGNVNKHAHAKNTWIVVERRLHDLVVAVRDDGRGFDVAHIEQEYDSRGSLGLLNMRERSEVLGAKYAIESKPGRGTLVYLLVPMVEAEAPTSADEPHEPAASDSDGRRKRSTGPLPPEPNGKRKKGTGPLGLVNHDQPSPEDEAE
jgi:signal transduction histidine kinase